METKHLLRDFTPVDQTLEPLTKVTVFDPHESLYDMGKLAGRAEAITIVIDLLQKNPNIDGLEILKAL